MPISRTGGSSESTYACTLTDIVNVSSDNTFATFVIPGGTWRDGEVVMARVIALKKNDSGTDREIILKASATGAAATTVHTSTTWVNSGSESIVFGAMAFFRGGSSLYIPRSLYDSGTAGALASAPQDMISNNSVFSAGFATLTPTSFDADITISLIVNFPAANANLYYKPRHVGAYKTVPWPPVG